MIELLIVAALAGMFLYFHRTTEEQRQFHLLCVWGLTALGIIATPLMLLFWRH